MEKSKYYLFLNPYKQYAWTKCPKCDHKTKVRKHQLAIHLQYKTKDDFQLTIMNTSCKFCENCELLIVNKVETEDLLQTMFFGVNQKFSSENYFILGTFTREVWKREQKKPLLPLEAINLLNPFKDALKFEVQPAGWYRSDISNQGLI